MQQDRDNLPDIQFDELLARMLALGVKRLLAKELAPNDNSKNQPYLSGSLDVLNILPTGQIKATLSDAGNTILKAKLPLEWLQADGSSAPAPHAKLILYPQYPEVRFSGFLLGAANAPSSVLSTREPGRILFFGVTDRDTIVAWACRANSQVASAYRHLLPLESEGVFRVIPLKAGLGDPRAKLLRELKRIHGLGWIESKALKPDGSIVSCDAPQCVGYTLEAELGVARNGRSEPDFAGWEIKASQVRDLSSTASRVLTLMTPEPTGGFYKSNGPEQFVRRFGYADLRGTPDRLNFGGRFSSGKREARTGLTLQVVGFDADQQKVTSPDGAIALMTDASEVAAEWSFAGLLNHWNRKHNRAAYALGQRLDGPTRMYRYGKMVQFGVGTDFGMLIAAIARGTVYYDPGIKVEDASTMSPKTKRRSQFRVSSKNLSSLYREFSDWDVSQSS